MPRIGRCPMELEFNRPLYRVNCYLRLTLLLHAWLLAAFWRFSPQVWLVWLVLAGATAWTLFVSARYIRKGATPWLVALDMLVTIGVVLLTGPVRGAQFEGLGNTLAGFWIIGAPLVVAIAGGVGWGVLASLTVCLVAWLQRISYSTEMWSSLLVILIAVIGLGYMVGQMRRSQHDRNTYYATAAALGERERLNRIVHDGVLQVLAMVEREATSLGPRGQQLAHEARSQEIALRALLQDKDVDVTIGEIVQSGSRSLTSALDRHESESVSISVLADDVTLPARAVEEIDAVVGEVLSNVHKHAGPDAKAFLLLEEDGDELILSIRDNGVGAKREDLLRAGDRGRFGVRESIQGRIRDLGGTARLSTAPGRGVEWEFRIPREQA